MNLERPFPAESTEHSYLQPKLIPLLVLINQWGSQGHTALTQTPCIILILECLQLTFDKSQQEFTLQTLVSQVENVMGKEKHEIYINSLHTLANCVLEFMKLFKQLKTLIEAPKKEEAETESTTPIIDSDNGVFGTLIKHCLQEYEILTFSQVVLFHRQLKQYMIESNYSTISLNIRKKLSKKQLSAAKRSKDITTALHTLMMSKSGGVAVELKALHLAMLMTQFNHIEESEFALKEAIRLAQLSENSLVLEHSLALLQHLQPSCSTNSRSLVNQFIQNAKEQNQPLLVSTGKIQLARLDLTLNADPKHVLTAILSSQFDVFNSYDEQDNKKAIHSTVLLLESIVYKQYNLSSLSHIPLQLLCYMSHDQDHTPHHISDLAKAIQLLARSLSGEGKLEMAIKLVQCSLHHLEHFNKSNVSNYDGCLKILLAEFRAEKALYESNWLIVQENIDKIRVFDRLLADYWSAKLLYSQTLYKSATSVCNTLLKILSTKSASIEIWTLETKVHLLQSDIFYAEGRNDLAVNILIDCITCCQKHHLHSLSVCAQLKLVRSQIQLEILDQITISELLPQLLTHGSSNKRAEAFLFLAQITILKSNKDTGYITNEAGYRALGLLSYAIAELHPISPPTHLMKHMLIFQAMLYHYVKDPVGVAKSFQLLSHR